MSADRPTSRRFSARPGWIWAAALVWLALVLAAVLFTASTLKDAPPESDIRGLLPDAGTPAEERALRAELAARHENTLTLFVAFPDDKKEGKTEGQGKPLNLHAEAQRLADLLAAIAPKSNPRSCVRTVRIRRSLKASFGRRPARR